jgi:hypothetical protein
MQMIAVMLAVFIACSDALKVGMSRRAAFAKAASLAPLVPFSAFAAELKQATDRDV